VQPATGWPGRAHGGRRRPELRVSRGLGKRGGIGGECEGTQWRVGGSELAGGQRRARKLMSLIGGSARI
jgi:hypothetical protein